MKRSIILLALLPTVGWADEMIGAVADGAPWKAQIPGGPTVRMTLNRNGSGEVRALVVRRQVTWVRNAGSLCISNLPMGPDPRCFKVEETDAGYALRAEDGEAISLSR